LTKQLNSSDARAGIFGHYPGSGANKWALVLHHSASGDHLELLDDQNPGQTQPVASAQCTIYRDFPYIFSLMIHGNNANGTAVILGGPNEFCQVAGSFPSTSPASTGTGFGLYAGGYSATFDIVAVATVSPSLTGTGFSNSFSSFYAGPTIHNALAGTAELQNGTGSIPVETYYGHYSWGGVRLVERRYDSGGVTHWL